MNAYVIDYLKSIKGLITPKRDQIQNSIVKEFSLASIYAMMDAIRDKFAQLNTQKKSVLAQLE